MALTAFETAEQRLPCRVEQADAGGKVVVAAAEQAVPPQEADRGGRLERDDIWNMIQSQKPPAAPAPRQAPYVPAPVRRSSSLLTQKSLEICTESLGSETGSDGFSDADGAADRSCPGSDDDGANGVAAPAMPPRAFPPPLPSLARRTVGSLQMRQHRRDGRLVVEAVPVLSNTLFRAQRRGGRLLLSFADTAAPAEDEGKNHAQETDQQQADERTHEEEEEEEEGEEVQVVDRGTIVEVKVSTQPQAHSSGARVHRSSLVINKFVGAEPVNASEINDAAAVPPQQPPKPASSSAAAALAAAPALSATATLPEDDDGTAATPCEGKVLMTTRRRRSKQELLNHMRRCGQLSGQLFIWEPRVATSS
ncbi:protein FAF-like, chloroplastic [Hordeum vulgare]|uniref:Predicted protein n=1 Tax=Hordeum vulgare subsp. vulgare TaxID=112509 RepID=F2DVB9_HORVV|nr:protein FANTASTIC FOUR 1-like [Hordeum vulgare subsp. vulgare]KAE8793729.1 protein FAF-like, chloroplastic [Hordeum vulgare]KAI4993771.1 hypothetical protein ZWY2020_008084 [Hordeum vulgare]BAJ99040.1 predicted protein [Hordeum vulgare subsp. vulgare]